MLSLADAGVEHLVMSPGSRSTPFVAAAVAVGRFQLHDVIDERAASFVALGIGRAMQRPAAVLCTSGSAAAHYYPAIIEAGLAHIPLVIITADRPSELQDCGAPQTIDQVKIYGNQVRKFVDLGNPEPALAALRGIRRIVAQTVAASMRPLPGVVHLNARARKPLEPEIPHDEPANTWLAAVRAIAATPILTTAASTSSPEPNTLTHVAAASGKARRGLIVFGPGSLDDVKSRETVFGLAARTGFPLLTEAPSQLRLAVAPAGVTLCDPFDLILRSPHFRESSTPDLVLQFGETPTSSAWEVFARSFGDGTKHFVFTPHAFRDPTGTATGVYFGDTEAWLSGLLSVVPALELDADRFAWRRRFERASAIAQSVIDSDLAAEGTQSEGGAVRTFIAALPDDVVLTVGNSLAIRHLDGYAQRRSGAPAIICQRGANGIDGLVAGTAGAAHALRRPTALLIGDVSLLHDLTSLALLHNAPRPLVIVVLNNGGGRIFEQLPLGTVATSGSGELQRLAFETMKHIMTEHETDFSHAAQLFRMRYECVDSAKALHLATQRAFAAVDRPSLIEVRLAPHGATAQHRRITERTTDQLRALVEA
jgi:2-succinyl-5-enolpyruvyl-6-hydroxy-3-cyclohexene-1-carboxylate synthase